MCKICVQLKESKAGQHKEIWLLEPKINECALRQYQHTSKQNKL